MMQKLNYRTALLSQTETCSGNLPITFWNTPHQSLALSISAFTVPTVTIRTYPNQKPWIKGNICTELKGRAAAFKVRDSNPEAYKKSCNALRRTINQAKRQYRAKIESYYTGSNARRMWQGLQTITDYNGKHSRELPSDTSLPDELNHVYARFEASNTMACMRASAVPDDCVVTLSVADVSKTFNWLNRSTYGARRFTRTCDPGMC
jgi:hypothetical protein